MSSIITAKFGPWPLGMNNVAADTDIPGMTTDDTGVVVINSVRDAINGTFNREGHFSRWPSVSLIHAGKKMHSLWTSPATGNSYLVSGNTLYLVSYDGNTVSLIEVAVNVIPNDSPVSYCDLNGDVIFTCPGVLGRINSNGVYDTVGVETPPGCDVTAQAAGGLLAGSYNVGLTFLAADEESGMSKMTTVFLPTGGGLQINVPRAMESKVIKARIYMTETNGDRLYRCTDVPADASYFVGIGLLGRVADTQFLNRMPSGTLVRYGHGRLWIVDGNTIWYSEAMRYGLTSPRHNHLYFSSPITILEPVNGGVWIGTTEQVWFLAGTGPETWSLVLTSGKPPIAGSGTTISAHLLGGDLGASGTTSAIWLAINGYVLGTSNGQLVEVQKDRITLTARPSIISKTFIINRQVYTLLH